MAAVMVRSRGAPSRTRRAAGSSRARRHGPQVACVRCPDAAEGRTASVQPGSARSRAVVLGEHRAARRAAPTIDSTRSRVASCSTKWSRVASSTFYLRLVRWAACASRTEARGGTVGPPLSVLLPPRLQEGRGEAPSCEGLGMKGWRWANDYLDRKLLLPAMSVKSSSIACQREAMPADGSRRSVNAAGSLRNHFGGTRTASVGIQ